MIFIFLGMFCLVSVSVKIYLSVKKNFKLVLLDFWNFISLTFYFLSIFYIWDQWNYRLWIFQTQYTNLEKNCLKINIPKGNYWILFFGLMVSCQFVLKFNFHSQFSMSKIIQIFLIVFIEFRSTFFVIDKINFQIALLLKCCPIFDSSTLIRNSKFNNFSLGILILMQQFF